MKFRIASIISALLLFTIIFAGATLASTLIWSDTNDYGIEGHKPGGNDVLYDDYVLVSDQWIGGQRFSDYFDFSDLAYDSIDRFDLTLTFSNTNRNFLGIPLEIWYMRPDGSLNYWSFKLDAVGNTPTSQIFSIDDTFQPEFDDILSMQKYEFWFAEEAWGANDFKLYSATLDIYGTSSPVSEPATMLLFGTGLIGLAGLRKKLKK